MEQLTRSPNCYIRASPTSGMLGGIAEHTNEIITLCEIGMSSLLVNDDTSDNCLLSFCSWLQYCDGGISRAWPI